MIFFVILSFRNAAKLTDLDQVLLALSSRIGDFIQYIGGAEYAPTLIDILETLCGGEEITARNAAAASVCKILSQFSVSEHTSQAMIFFELFKRLSNEEAGEVFYSRVSSCHIVPELYRVLPDSVRPQLREIYSKLIVDELPMVRRAAANNFLKVAKYAETDILVGEFLQIMKSLATDEHSTVRVIGTEILAQYTRMVRDLDSPQAVAANSELLPIIKTAVEDASWRVRVAISKKFGTFATTFTPTEVSAELFHYAVHLISDVEPDVRQQSLESLLAFQPIVSQTTYLAELMPIAAQLVEDPMLSARQVLAELCIDVAAKVGPDAVAHHLTDTILKLVADEDPMVRVRILKKLPVIAEEIPSLCTRLTEQLKGMFSDPNWRVRRELVLAMPAIVKFMGQDYFTEHFQASLLNQLKDGVDEVRRACGIAIPKLTTIQNANWVHEKLFPSVRAMATEEFLVRLSMLTTLKGFLETELPERFQSEVLGLVISAVRDKVPNVRVRSAQVLGSVCGFVGEEISRAHIRPALTELLGDKDKDVVYFSSEGLKRCA
jgi:serine/threonine-protein phosphatase 2A regulatory subunit A